MSEEQKDSERLALLQAALDQIDQGFTVFDANLEMIGWNERFFDLLDFPKDLARTGTPFSAFMEYNTARGEYGPGDPQAQIESRVARARTFLAHEFERSRPSGQVLSVRGTPLPGGGFVTTYTDITAERERQAALTRAVEERTRALSESEARLRLITDAVPAMIAYVDDRTVYRFANRRYAEWFGLEPATIVNRSLRQVVEAPVVDELEAQLKRVLAGESPTYEYSRIGPNGRRSDMRSSLLPDRDATGRVRGCFVLSLDITEQKAHEAALRQAQKMEAVGQLTGGLAHDFNNLLTVILGNLSALRRKLDDPALAQDYIDSAIHAADRGAELTQRLLAFAREQPLAAKAVDVEACVVGLSRLLRRSLPSSIEVATRLRGLPPLAFVDPGQLENALLNLALNARDAISGPGRIVFAIAEAQLDDEEAKAQNLAPGRYVSIVVEDSGSGIKSEALGRVFDPFYTTKQFGSGSGLGLSMVYGFIRQSAGGIALDSTPGEGTRVTLLLPAATAEQAAAVAGPSAELEEAAGLGDSLVLLVEDDPQVRSVVREQLTAIGCRVLEAENSEDALALVSSVPEVNLLLSDVVMPGQLDGLALARRAKDLVPELKVALISGYSGMMQSCLPEDCPFPLLGKPFTEAQLGDLLSRAV